MANPLRAGFGNCTESFYKFLEITEKYGSQDNSDISKAINTKLSELATENDVKKTVSNASLEILILIFKMDCIQQWINL